MAENVFDEAHIAADKEIARMEKRLRKIYKDAYDDIGKEWKEYLDGMNAETERLRERIKNASDPKEKKKLEAAYQRHMRLNTTMHRRYNQLTERVAREMSNVNQMAADYVNGRAPKVYADTWNWNGKDIEAQTGAAVRFDIINPNTVKNLVQEDASFLPEYKIDPTKDVPWNMRAINSEVAKGVIAGEPIDKIKARLQNVCDMNEKSAERAARTIVTATENKARMDTAHEAQEKGVKMRKMWISAHDSRVREWHEQADADYHSREKAIDVDEPFIVNGEELMFPGDPSGSPENVYNCRCSTSHVIDGFTSNLPPERRGKIKVTFR